METIINPIWYKEFGLVETETKNQFDIIPVKDENGDIVVLESKIATVNPARADAEKMARLLAAAPEMMSVLLDLRDGEYNLTREAWAQINRVIEKVELKSNIWAV